METSADFRMDALETRPSLLSHPVYPIEMSSTPLLQCLFCKHDNPAGASFCNACGSPLNFQQCEQCDAINKRGASNCYKCGAEFALPLAPGLDMSLMPTDSDHQMAGQARRQRSMAGNNASLAGSAEPALRVLGHEVHGDGMRPVHTGEDGITVDPAKGARRRWSVAVSFLVVAALGISAYFYRQQPAQAPAQETVEALAPSLPGQSGSADETPAKAQAQGTTRSTPASGRQARVASAEGAAKRLVPPVPDAGATDLRPSSAPDATGKPRQDPPIFKECPEAVAILGFCSPMTRQENH